MIFTLKRHRKNVSNALEMIVDIKNIGNWKKHFSPVEIFFIF